MIRQIEETLLRWKNDQFCQPLLIKGIRQCGKTWLLKEFGKNHYQNTIFLNIEWNKLLHDTFDRGLDVSRITREIEGIQGRQITKDTLLIFDEIQFCPAALTSLKYFAEEKNRRFTSLVPVLYWGYISRIWEQTSHTRLEKSVR